MHQLASVRSLPDGIASDDGPNLPGALKVGTRGVRPTSFWMETLSRLSCLLATSAVLGRDDVLSDT